MKNLNRFQFIGKIIKDTELRYIEINIAIGILNIVTHGNYTIRGLSELGL